MQRHVDKVSNHKSISISSNRSRISQLRKIEQSDLPPYDPEQEVENAIACYEKQPKVSYWSLFRYATVLDKILMIMGTILSLLSAFCIPWKIALIGELMHVIIIDVRCDSSRGADPSSDTVNVINTFFHHAIYIFVVETVLWYISFRFLSASANNQINVMRLTFFSKLITKDMSWFDYFVNRPYVREKTVVMSKIRNGIGETVGRCVYTISACFSLTILCLIIDYKLTLALVIVIPFGILASTFGATADRKQDESINKSKAMSAIFAEDALSNIKVVKIFQAEMKLKEQYVSLLRRSNMKGIRWLTLASFCLAIFYLTNNLSYWIAFWWGPTVIQFNLCGDVREILEDNLIGVNLNVYKGPVKLFMVFLSTVFVSVHIMDIPKYIVDILAAKDQASELYFAMDLPPRINNPALGGFYPKNSVIGRVEFWGVSFRYIRTPSKWALRGVTMMMYPGQIIAIIGEPGCGKTTILKLIDRLYDPCEGQISIDGNHSEAVDVTWLRKYICFIMQNPILFNATVEENFRCIKPNVTMKDIIEACKTTEIHEYISDLPHGYSTVVTDKGGMFNEKQKRLLCLARALIQRPRILLLDDPQPDKSDPIYDSLLTNIVNKLREHATVVFTSTKCTELVKNADFIFVMRSGEVVQSGIHRKLIHQHGVYHNLLEESLDITSTVKHRFPSQLAAYRYSTMLEKSCDIKEADSVVNAHESTKVHHVGKPFLKKAKHGVGDKRDLDIVAYGFIGYHRQISFQLSTRDKQIILENTPTASFASIVNMGDVKHKKKKMNQNLDTPTPKTLRVINENTMTHRLTGTHRDEDSISIKSGDSAIFWNDYLWRLESWYNKIGHTSWMDFFLLVFTKGVWPYVLIGILASIALGFVIPCNAYLLGTVYLAVTKEKRSEREEKVFEAAFYFLYVGIGSAFAGFIQIFAFGVAGQKLNNKLQIELFDKMLLQDLRWYDKAENDIHTLCDALKKDTHLVQKSVILYYGLLFQILTSIILSITWAIFLNNTFRTAALILVAVCPLYFFMALIKRKQILGQDQEALSNATDLAFEVFNNIQAVASLNLEKYFIEEYKKRLLKKSWSTYILHISEWLIMSMSTSLPFLVFGCFIYLASPGNLKTNQESLNFQDMLRIAELLIMGMVSISQQLVILPDTRKGRIALNKLKSIILSKPDILESSETSTVASTSSIVASTSSTVVSTHTSPPLVVFKDVVFQYPVLTDVSILNGICMEFVPETFVAIVGPEGCGKSSIATLFSRLYDPTSGTIMFGDKDSTKMPLHVLRRLVKIVDSRDLGLLNMSIEETIALGESNRTVSIEDIEAAAMETRTHHIIKKLKNGYATKIKSLERTPENHALKQRIALARAIIGDPKILILNGFTTAGDTINTVLMQCAINNAREGRTLVVLSERIEPIRNADVIIVMNSGYIVEAGDDTELLAKKGLYYNLLMTQRLMDTSDVHRVTFVEPEESIMSVRPSSLSNHTKNSAPYSKFIQATRVSMEKAKAAHKSEGDADDNVD